MYVHKARCVWNEERFHCSLETEMVSYTHTHTHTQTTSTHSLGQDTINRVLLSHEKHHWTLHRWRGRWQVCYLCRKIALPTAYSFSWHYDVTSGSARESAKSWIIRPAQKRNNKSFKIRPLLNPPSYAELGCALPAPTQKQRGFLKSHCLSKPAHSIDVYLSHIHTFTSLPVRSFIITGALSHKHVDTWPELHLARWCIKTIGDFFSTFTVSAVLRYQNLCYRPPPAARGIWKEGPSPMCPSNIPAASPKGAALPWFFARFQTGDLCLVSLNSPCMWN